MKKENKHKKFCDEIINWFRERGFVVNDFEKIIGDRKVKRPDILVYGENLLVEVKTIQENYEQNKETHKINKQLAKPGEVAFWKNDLFNRISEDIRSSRGKFKEYPNFKTAVIFVDLLSNLHRQDPELLLRGNLSYVINKKVGKVEKVIRKNRILRSEKNKDIGAILFTKNNFRNAFKVYHNMSAKSWRRIDNNFFNKEQDENFEFYDDCCVPLIKKV